MIYLILKSTQRHEYNSFKLFAKRKATVNFCAIGKIFMAALHLIPNCYKDSVNL